MERHIRSEEIVVLTTHERSSLFAPVLGENADMRYDPRKDPPLQDLMHNIALAGGKLIIIDEHYFIDEDDLPLGIEHFVLNENGSRQLKVIIVCLERKQGDPLLSFLVMSCGLYNIIYDTPKFQVSSELARLMQRDNTLQDVFHLTDAGRWKWIKQAKELGSTSTLDQIGFGLESSVHHSFGKVTRRLSFDAWGLVHVDIMINLKPIKV